MLILDRIEQRLHNGRQVGGRDHWRVCAAAMHELKDAAYDRHSPESPTIRPDLCARWFKDRNALSSACNLRYLMY